MNTGGSSDISREAEKGSKYSAPALEKGLDILEFLATQPAALTQSEIGRALGRGQSEIYRMLACLEERGYVRKEANGSYRFSLRLYELAHQQSSITLLRQAALPEMDALANRTHQSVHLSTEHDTHLLVLVERMPMREICLSIGAGNRLSLTESTSGKVFLSTLDPDRMMARLSEDPDFQSYASAQKSALLSEVSTARSDGYLLSASKVTPGGHDIAMAVGVRGSDTAAVLAVPFVTRKEELDCLAKRYLKEVIACGKAINGRLGILHPNEDEGAD